jgi:hypothetical protein
MINLRPVPNGGHWVVFDRPERGSPRVLNPAWWLKQPIRTDIARIKVAYYVTLRFPPPAGTSKAANR